jgi:hypothetical protein
MLILSNCQSNKAHVTHNQVVELVLAKPGTQESIERCWYETLSRTHHLILAHVEFMEGLVYSCK